ncbi:hypothetical protein ABID22_000761 [Pontibacter aydingkolensis]
MNLAASYVTETDSLDKKEGLPDAGSPSTIL